MKCSRDVSCEVKNDLQEAPLNDYYVYVYIDPRNFEEFYYGKGRGNRKDSHRMDSSDSTKVHRIKVIEKEKQKPIIRVIARNLSEDQALLVEKTLLWKFGKSTENVATGHFKDNFRPKDTMHKELLGFDYQNGIYFYNVGEGEHRNWEDYVRYGFISAGQRETFRKAMLGFSAGDMIAAYIPGRGYVGVGKILTKAKRIRDVGIKGKKLLDYPLKCRNMGDNSESAEKSEYVCLVEWLKTVTRDQAWKYVGRKLFAPRNVRATLDGQDETIEFIRQKSGIDLNALRIARE